MSVRHDGLKRVAHRRQRKQNVKGRATSLALALRTHTAAMQLDELLDDRKPQTEAAMASCRRAVRLAKSVEHVREKLQADAFARVVH